MENNTMTDEQWEASNAPAFDQWKAAVSTIVEAATGGLLSCDDGIGWPSRRTFDAGCTPRQGALAWLEAQDYLDKDETAVTASLIEEVAR